MTNKAGTRTVAVLIRQYVYKGHPYGEGETIHMDLHDIPGAIQREQVKLGGGFKPIAKTPSKAGVTGPSATPESGPADTEE